MLTPSQESSLTSAGDCFEHYHSSDRQLVHTDVAQLQGLAVIVTVTGDYTVNGDADFILADTSVAAVTVTLPLASNGREIEIVKAAAPNYLSIKTAGANLVLTAGELRVYNYGTALRLKAVTNGWVII